MTGNFKKKLMQMANRLFSKGFSRSSALATAWRIVKSRKLQTKVAGVTFEGRQNILALLATYPVNLIRVELYREPQNPYDKNAVAVVATVSGRFKAKLGYLPASVASVVSAVLDKGLAVHAEQLRIVGGCDTFQNYGARITVAI